MILLAAAIPSLIGAFIFWLLYKLYKALTGPGFDRADLLVDKTTIHVGEPLKIEFKWTVDDNDDHDEITFAHWFELEDIGATPKQTGRFSTTVFHRTLQSRNPTWQTPGEKTIRAIAEILVRGEKIDVEAEGTIEVVPAG